ncbi:MAG: peptidoglycan-binding protein [Rhodospirillales bacterium]|nr:peptidoglycan-binding protein [Rhodospirillales bacterium]
MKRLGYYDGDTELRYIDRPLDSSIRQFQQNNKLLIDGVITPRGETETAMNIALKKVSDNQAPSQMPALPRGTMEKEELPPPNIPGTNIPDQGIAEGAKPRPRIPGIDTDTYRYKMDPDVWKKPPSMDKDIMLPFDPNYPVIPSGRRKRNI